MLPGDIASDGFDNVAEVRRHMHLAAEAIGATIVGDTFHHFSPQGVSGSLVIAESHLSVHTWPETGYVALDIYTCGGLDPRLGFEYLGRAFHARKYRVQEIVRGLPEDVAEGRPLLPDDVEVLQSEIEIVDVTPPS